MKPGPTVWASAVVTRRDEILVVRKGPGPAGGHWDLPRTIVEVGETLAEAVVRITTETCGIDQAVCGPFVAWEELLGEPDEPHDLIMHFNAVLLGDADAVDSDATGLGTAGERRWVSTYLLADLRTRDGLIEFLSDQSIIDIVV